MKDIVDTAGQDSYKPLLESYMNFGDGFLLVYDITNPVTFRYVQCVAHELLDVKMTPLVCCKIEKHSQNMTHSELHFEVVF